MSVLDNMVAVLTILSSLLLVVVIIGAAWWLMWKVTILKHVFSQQYLSHQVFLSRFQFINEILFPPAKEEEKQKTVSRRKIRKD